ncbi:MAG: hypothetical protein IPH84_04655 [Bacteroidales bacterium]|nr:hypothetical protein [Bacteroidales bacterium]
MYEKIDLIYYSDAYRLKSDIIVHPNGDLSKFKFKINGNIGVSVKDNGDLEISTIIGLMIERIPEAYQLIGNKKILVNLNYHIDNRGIVSLIVGKYDKNFDLIIDPELTFLSYCGGSGDDFFLSGNSVTDTEGNIYFTGRTTSLNFPTTPGVVSPSYNGGFDAFVVKMDPTGENIIFSTYLGGPGNDYGYSIKLIGSNNDIVIAGDASIGFPVTSGSYQTNFQGGPYDVFIARINNSGDNIVFSTFLGGPAEDQPFQIHIDNQENICIVGQTSGNFPITPNAFQTSNGGWYDIFVSKLNSSGNQLLASTYIDSTNADRGVGITSDNESNIYITGIVQGTFPTTSGAYDNTFNGGTYDIIACKFDSNLTTLLYSTYLGTSGDDIPRGEPNIDENKNLLITGKAGPGFLHQSFAFQILFGGGNSDGIVIKLSSDGSMVIRSTYLGGTGDDFIQNIEISADYQLFLTGSCGLEFPTTQCCYDNTFNGGLSDGFLTVLDTTLVQLIYSTFLGGNNIDQGMSIHLIADTVYLLGETKSPNLPTTPNALDPTYNGGYDIFLMKLLLSDGPSSTAFAGNDLTVCTDDLPVLLSEATATNALSVEWTTSGTGSFNSASILNPVYTPSLNDISAGQVLLILTPSNGSSCEGIADTLILFIQKAALLNAGPDVTICQSGSYTISGASAQNVTSVNWTHNGNGTLLSPNTITPTYLSAPNETTDVTLTLTGIGLSPCSNEQDQLIIHIQPSPQTFAGFDDTLCGELLPYLLQDSYIINSSNPYWTSSGTGSFSNPNTLHPTYTPSLNDLTVGSVSLTLISSGISPCLASSDFLVLKFLSTATANAGLDATTCQNSPYTITTASASGYTSVIWSHNGQGSLSNASTLTPTYTPGVTENGIVVLTLTANGNPPCGQITNSMNLTINPSATSFAGSNASICEGSSYTLSASNAANYSSLTWSTSGNGSFNNTGILHPVYTPSLTDIQSGSVVLTLTANSLAACQSAVSGMTLQISVESN